MYTNEEANFRQRLVQSCWTLLRYLFLYTALHYSCTLVRRHIRNLKYTCTVQRGKSRSEFMIRLRYQLSRKVSQNRRRVRDVVLFVVADVMNPVKVVLEVLHSGRQARTLIVPGWCSSEGSVSLQSVYTIKPALSHAFTVRCLLFEAPSRLRTKATVLRKRHRHIE